MTLQEKIKRANEMMKETGKTAKECMLLVNALEPKKEYKGLNLSNGIKVSNKEMKKWDLRADRKKESGKYFDMEEMKRKSFLAQRPSWMR